MRHTPKAILPDGVPFELLSRHLDKVQLRLATSQAQWYKSNAAFDDVLAQQQRVIYTERNSILHQQDIRVRFEAILNDVLAAEVKIAVQTGSDPRSLVARLMRLYPVAGASYIGSAMRPWRPGLRPWCPRRGAP
jgi:preprotein translocase subunit SecA